MTLSSGSRLGPYEIRSPLGAGGMGEVYRAQDPRLGREVAIKVLPGEFSQDAERLARFDREARALAALNHANIAAIFGLEQSVGTRFLVLELVPGETLSEKLASGPLPVDRDRGTLRGKPRTVGLFTAHLRDLAVSGDGRRLIIVEDETSRNLTRLPLAPGGGAPAGPEEPISTGRVIDGYPQVSPDGRRIAYVSDILGRTEVWIIDLETRRRQRLQLPGQDAAETEPAWMPNGRELVVVRYFADGSSAGWIAALDGSRSEEVLRSKSRSVVQFRPTHSGSSFLVSEVLGTEQLGLYDIASRKKTALTVSGGDKFDGEWSPDGRWIALTASNGETVQLFRMPASGGSMQQLTTGSERMRHPFWSPDGKWIYIQPSHRNIFRVRAEGGPLEQVTCFPEAGLFLEEPTMSPNGKYLVYSRENGGSSLWLMTLKDSGGVP